ncbi:cob(I)yrinic acid a,c-diamide adenosyltransferase [Maribacter polysiphoniae]|uniref:corrinoid adenosyltransferase n=1 Tax=Maribacter polysiphoniae TaxID=429344 RepID=A0A316E2Z6_9FLAO|nr:cob(I)yrinic acid a,c-diamide adenosyltransferase [Maribacter polysiphoniae]PWK24028.1 cob(I)alamin adenosyltransferase [Maribacter polysiphoniae]
MFDVQRTHKADIDAARSGFIEVSEIILSGKYDVVVLHEANIAMYCKLFGVEEIKHYDTKGIEARMGIEY